MSVNWGCHPPLFFFFFSTHYGVYGFSPRSLSDEIATSHLGQYPYPHSQTSLRRPDPRTPIPAPGTRLDRRESKDLLEVERMEACVGRGAQSPSSWRGLASGSGEGLRSPGTKPKSCLISSKVAYPSPLPSSLVRVKVRD